ncbi:hypothetical protein [Campylobacter fetus]|uniref:hypothetical protein n=1 Tax=Campylobacter fetus TaxID=196 RepID=UPI001F3B9E63|nr:hypothetical protein [Campylobacter fetus]
MIVAFSGCSAKSETITVYKDVFVPVACNATMPKKPKNDGSFESKKELMGYFLECESLLLQCTLNAEQSPAKMPNTEVINLATSKEK